MLGAARRGGCENHGGFAAQYLRVGKSGFSPGRNCSPTRTGVIQGRGVSPGRTGFNLLAG
jgi:hypothetical protein